MLMESMMATHHRISEDWVKAVGRKGQIGCGPAEILVLIQREVIV